MPLGAGGSGALGAPEDLGEGRPGGGPAAASLTHRCVRNARWPVLGPAIWCVVGDTGFEPVTSSVSGKRATAAPIAQAVELCQRWVRDLNPCTRICSPLPRLSANPPGEPFQGRTWWKGFPSGRRDSNSRHPPWQGGALPTELRPHVASTRFRAAQREGTLAHRSRRTKTGVAERVRWPIADAGRQVRAPCRTFGIGGD